MKVFVGPVHSEKSTKACYEAMRYRRLGHSVILLRPSSSIRTRPHPDVEGGVDPEWDRPGMLVTKNGTSFESVDFDSIIEIESLAQGYDVVWFDEIMLAAASEPHLQESAFAAIQRIRMDSLVLISGLSSTSELDVFTNLMAWLLATADEIEQCRADCDACGAFAAATRSVCLREKIGKVLVGGEADYHAMCPSCWTAAMTKATVV